MTDLPPRPAPPVVVGVDLSLKSTGIAHRDGKTDTYHPVDDGETHHGLVRMDEIARFIDIITDVPDLELVVIEGLAFEGHDTKRSQAQLTGIVRHMLWRQDKPFILVAPNTLKKYATGTGQAGKVKVYTAARDRLGYRGESFDEADALWLWAIGCHLLMGEPVVPLPQSHLAALGVLVKQIPTRR